MPSGAPMFLPVSSMDKSTDQGSCSDQSVLALPVGSLHLLCEVRPSANDEVALACSACKQGLLDQPSHLCAVADSRPPHRHLSGCAG